MMIFNPYTIERIQQVEKELRQSYRQMKRSFKNEEKIHGKSESLRKDLRADTNAKFEGTSSGKNLSSVDMDNFDKFFIAQMKHLDRLTNLYIATGIACMAIIIAAMKFLR
jgi:hypothetical protein